jgi:hypothetical protein
MGARFSKPWNEFQKWKPKAKLVFKALGMKPDWNKRLYRSLVKMKTFRDTIAHGKPVEDDLDYEATDTMEEIRKGFNLRQPWEDMCTHDEIMQAYEDTDVIWKEMLTHSKLEPLDHTDQAEFGAEILERLD